MDANNKRISDFLIRNINLSELKGEAWFDGQLPIFKDIITIYLTGCLNKQVNNLKELHFKSHKGFYMKGLVFPFLFPSGVVFFLVHLFMLAISYYETVDIPTVSAIIKVNFMFFIRRSLAVIFSSQGPNGLETFEKCLNEVKNADLNNYKDEIMLKIKPYATKIKCILKLILNFEEQREELIQDPVIATILSIPDLGFDIENLDLELIHSHVFDMDEESIPDSHFSDDLKNLLREYKIYTSLDASTDSSEIYDTVGTMSYPKYCFAMISITIMDQSLLKFYDLHYKLKDFMIDSVINKS